MCVCARMCMCVINELSTQCLLWVHSPPHQQLEHSTDSGRHKLDSVFQEITESQSPESDGRWQGWYWEWLRHHKTCCLTRWETPRSQMTAFISTTKPLAHDEMLRYDHWLSLNKGQPKDSTNACLCSLAFMTTGNTFTGVLIRYSVFVVLIFFYYFLQCWGSS